jgi:hypothetical protein
MTSEQIDIETVEHRLLDALQGARSRRERQLRRQEQRKSRWLTSFSKFGLDRHHASELQSQQPAQRQLLL